MSLPTETGAVHLPGRSTGAFRALRHRNFQLLFPANVVSNAGGWAQRVAQDWLVLELTHQSAQDLGIVTALQFLPTLLVSTWAGLLADRFSKRMLLIYTNLCAGLTSGLLGWLIVSGQVQLWHAYVLAFVLGIFTAVDAPIRQSFNSEIVGIDDLPSAISLNSANFNIGRLVGPAVSGFLIEAFGTGPSFLINAVSYVGVIFALLAMRTRDLLVTPPVAKGSQIREAFWYIMRRPDLVWVMAAVFTTATFGLNFQIFIALMATSEFHRHAGDFGLLGTALAVGTLTGALVSARLEKYRLPRNILLVMSAFGVMLSVLSFAPNYLSFGLLLPVCGALALLGAISANSYVQTTTEPSLRGRVMGIYLLIFMGGTPIGSSLLGLYAQQEGIRATILVCGMVTLIAPIVFLWLLNRHRQVS
jgi:predicted MFS family arabinose efflux permease